MKLTYDPKHNVAYLQFRDKAAEVETIKLSDDLLIDIAPDGTLYGIELLDANAQLAGDGLKKFVLLDQATGKQSEIAIGG